MASLIQACINGSRTVDEHPGIPVSIEQIAADTQSVVAAGAGSIHIHPRDAYGRESIEPEVVAQTLLAIRRHSPDVPVGITTGAWITEPSRRPGVVASWVVHPDFASVNVSEDGSIELAWLLNELGIGLEIGVMTPQDAQLLLESGLVSVCLRVLVEIDHQPDPALVLTEVAAIESILGDLPVRQLHHGTGIATWKILQRALKRGHDIRIGFEDTLTLPNGETARSNTELVEIARDLAERA